MAIFYTHSRLGPDVVDDDEGADYDDPECARQSAITAGRLIVAEEITRGANAVELELYVDNDQGERIATVGFSVLVARHE